MNQVSLIPPYPDSWVHGANMGPTWVLLAPDGPHVGPMNLAIMVFKGCVAAVTSRNIFEGILIFQDIFCPMSNVQPIRHMIRGALWGVEYDDSSLERAYLWTDALAL